MRRLKTSLSFSFGLVLALGFGFVTASSASAVTCVGTSVSTFAEIQTGLSAGSSMCLTQDLTQTDFGSTGQLLVPSGRSASLDLNGFGITFTASAAMAAIQLPVGATLTISDSVGSGSLNVTGGQWFSATGSAAGIGGDGGVDAASGMSAGTLIINGGTITTRGGSSTGALSSGSGIGGGGGGVGSFSRGNGGSGGTVILNGGKVVSNSGAGGSSSGAGIGGGSSSFGAIAGGGGTMTINASGTPSAAGTGWSQGSTQAGVAAIAQVGSTPAGVSFQQVSTNSVNINSGGRTEVTFSYAFAFNSEGGSSVSSSSVEYGNLVTEPTAPTRSGFTFNGWRTSSSSGASYSFSSPVTAPVTLYANWTANSAPTPQPTSDPAALAATGFEKSLSILYAGIAALVAGAFVLFIMRRRGA